MGEVSGTVRTQGETSDMSIVHTAKERIAPGDDDDADAIVSRGARELPKELPDQVLRERIPLGRPVEGQDPHALEGV